MKRKTTVRILTTGALIMLAGVLASRPAVAGQTVQQTFQLNPGWNAIYLEVQPEPADPESVFAGVPLASVWTWVPRSSPVTFLRDPSEGLLNDPGWLGYFPPGPNAFLTNLHAIQANRPYLVNYRGETPLSLNVAGTPVPRPVRWQANSFTLAGFPVDPGNPPSFGGFFAGSPAHAGQPIYRLSTGGEWQPVASPQSETIRSGEAYWVYSRGVSDHSGPIRIDTGGDDSLHYGLALQEKTLRIEDRSGHGASVTIRALPSPNPVALSYWRLETVTDPETGNTRTVEAWPALGNQHTVQVGPGKETVLRLAVRRAAFGANQVSGILEVKDGAGMRYLIPASAERRVSAIAGTEQSGDPTGLWLGSVTIEEVGAFLDPTDFLADPNGVLTDPNSTTPVGKPFTFRLLIHVDDSATPVIKLLKQVTQMFSDGNLYPDGTLAQAGKYALVTEDLLLDNFQGAGLWDGEPVGYRVSTAGYDFPGTSVVMQGAFVAGQTLRCNLTLPASEATNPFQHLYHPDHADDSTFYELYEVQRRWLLSLDAAAPDDDPDWGDTLMTGTFAESISIIGLHRNDIAVRGSVRLRHVSTTPALNE